MTPRKPGAYQCRIPVDRWQTREIIRGDKGELRVVTKDGSEKFHDDGPFSMGDLNFEWRELPTDTRQIELKI